ncbi:GTP-binding protein [Pelagicoccus albus]|uniref:CobW/HypB/UreG nucleotide-binding domain-containing protein n=1 Tax=Pelagicoccus albus TaxID=415222 RepID=A0A7X1B6B8_9BACT|nr:GTP-binding protein [Pelagicoccus albus]MBC2606479.1 hypothetical protein [Pelagicoccus albus]
MGKPLVYLVLGCKGSEQFKVVSDLIEFGTSAEESAAVYYSSHDEDDFSSDFGVKHRQAATGVYQFSGRSLDLTVEGEPDLVFIVADGLANPSDVVEAFHAWLPESGCELARVLTVLNCDLAVERKVAFAWFECCIHFSDVVLLAKRENVANKSMKAFLDHYEEECYPCLWVYVKKGRVNNPSLVLDIQARRITRIFDVPEVFDDDEEEDYLDEEIAGDITKDRFLKCISGGHRALELPDISKFL